MKPKKPEQTPHRGTDLISVKLPSNIDDFIERCSEEIPVEWSFAVDAFVKEPEHTIPVNGYFSKFCEKKPVLTKNQIRYRMQRNLKSAQQGKKMDLKRVKESLAKSILANGFSSFTIQIRSATFFIHKKKYFFGYHAPAKMIVLKSIDNKPIGKMTKEKQEALLCEEGDLHFCFPSVCRLRWKKDVVCT